MELIDFLDLYSKNFDNAIKSDIKASISSAFQECLKMQIIHNYDTILKDENIGSEIKNILINLCEFREIQQQEISKDTYILDKIQTINKEQSPQMVCSASTNNQNNSTNNSINIPKNYNANNGYESDDSENELKITDSKCIVPELNNLDNEVVEHSEVKKKLNAEIEFYVNQNLCDLIDIITLNNFINFRSKKTFVSLFENFMEKFLQKLKAKNLLDSKLALIDQEVTDVYLYFAVLYVKIFKDELELGSVDKIFNVAELSFNPVEDLNSSEDWKNLETSASQNNKLKKKKTLSICYVILELYFLKIKNKNEKEISILAEIINKIIDLYPQYIINTFGFLIKRFHELKINRANEFKLSNFQVLINKKSNFDKIYIDVVERLFKQNKEFIKSRLRLLFDICVKQMKLEFLNNFIQKGLIYFTHIIENDQEFILKIINYSTFETINHLSLYMKSNYLILDSNNPSTTSPNNKFSGISLLSDKERMSKLIEFSVDLTIFEQEKLWILINSIKNLRNILPLKDITMSLVQYLRYLKSKQNNDANSLNFYSCRNLIFKNFLMTVRMHYITDILIYNESSKEKNFSNFVILFEIPSCFSGEIYEMFKNLSSFIQNFPEYFSLLVSEFLKGYEEENKSIFYENFLIMVKDFIFYEKYNLFSILFDTKDFTIKHLIEKLDHICKVIILYILLILLFIMIIGILNLFRDFILSSKNWKRIKIQKYDINLIQVNPI